MKRAFIFFFTCILPLASCVSSDKTDKKVSVRDDMPVPEVMQLALENGGSISVAAVRLVRQRNQSNEASYWLKEKVVRDHADLLEPQLLEAVKLYQVLSPEIDFDLIRTLMISKRKASRQLGWRLASISRSPEVTRLAEATLTKAIWTGNEQHILIPEVARAIEEHKLYATYSILKVGLMETGDPAFANAMIVLDKNNASADFLTYLNLASIEDLRQLNQKTINPETALVILNHMRKAPPSIRDPKVETIFLYAISRNQLLAELAKETLEKMYVSEYKHLAHLLGRLPTWIQVAYIENVRKSPNPNTRLFLMQLKEVTLHSEVVDEINDVG